MEHGDGAVVTVAQSVFSSKIGDMSRLMFIFFQANVATRRDILINSFLAYVAKNVATSSSGPICGTRLLPLQAAPQPGGT